MRHQLSMEYLGAEMQTAVAVLMPAGRHDLHGERRILERFGRIAVANLAICPTLRRQKDLELAKVVQLVRQCV